MNREHYEEQTGRQSPASDRFLQEFNQVCLWLRISFIPLIHTQGLKDPQVAYLVIHNKNITAQTLLEIMEALVDYLIEQDKTGLEIFRQTRDRFRKLLAIRNTLVHENQFTGRENEPAAGLSEMRGNTIQMNGAEHPVRHSPKSERELLAVAEECKQVNILFSRFFSCIASRFEPTRNFTKDENGMWRPRLLQTAQ